MKSGVACKARFLNNEDPEEEILAKIMDIKLALNMEADKEELFWEQRTIVNWLRMGDKTPLSFIILHPTISRGILLKN